MEMLIAVAYIWCLESDSFAQSWLWQAWESDLTFTPYALNPHADQPGQALKVGTTSSLRAPHVLEINPSRTAAGCCVQVYHHFAFFPFFFPYAQNVNMQLDKCSK